MSLLARSEFGILAGPPSPSRYPIDTEAGPRTGRVRQQRDPAAPWPTQSALAEQHQEEGAGRRAGKGRRRKSVEDVRQHKARRATPRRPFTSPPRRRTAGNEGGAHTGEPPPEGAHKMGGKRSTALERRLAPAAAAAPVHLEEGPAHMHARGCRGGSTRQWRAPRGETCRGAVVGPILHRPASGRDTARGRAATRRGRAIAHGVKRPTFGEGPPRTCRGRLFHKRPVSFGEPLQRVR